MTGTGIRFTWKNGSMSSNAIQFFEENGISWEYNHLGTLTADFLGIGIFEKIDFRHLEDDDYEICIA